MEIYENRNQNHNFDFIIIDFVPPIEACKTNFIFLNKMGKVVLGYQIKVDGIEYEVVDYDIGKGGTPHRYSLGLGVNKK